MTYQEYFRQYENYFWQPEADEDALVFTMPGGSTIVYGNLLMRILADLAPQGIPPLGALLLALIATNHAQGDPLQLAEEIIRKAIKDSSLKESDSVDEAMSFLRTLATIPLKYSHGDQRIQLLQVIFNRCHRIISADRARKMLVEASRMVNVLAWRRDIFVVEKLTYGAFHQDIRCIALLSRKFPDEDSIIRELAAIPDMPDTAPLEEVPQPKPAGFPESLIENPTTFPIGILIRFIWSGLDIPIHHRLPGEQPLGGFSDLSNKGSFDKLLITEFANDEWLLLSRLANNEALFLHREIPPGADDLQRIFLLDISLRSWGTPKVIAFAILLAIARHPRTDIRSEAYAVGDRYFPVSFGTMDELIESLKQLDASPDPAAGLQKFLLERNLRKKLEVIFIASPETLARPAVQKAIAEYQSIFRYIISAGRQGEVLVYKSQAKSRRLVQQLQIPLEKLREQHKKTAQVREAVIASSGPQSSQAPVLYPPSGQVKAILTPYDGEYYYVGNWGKLFRRHRNANLTIIRGWELLFSELPSGASQFAIGKNEEGNLILLSYDTRANQMALYNIDTGKVRPIALNSWKGNSQLGFFFHDGHFYFEGANEFGKIVDEKLIVFGRDGSESQAMLTETHNRKKVRPDAARDKFNKSVFRHLDRVAISSAGHLLINKHQLSCSHEGHMILRGRDKIAIGDSAAVAKWDQHTSRFIFAGGNSVTLDKSGMLILEWGAVPRDTFDVVLWNGGPNKLNAVKTIKDHTKLSLRDSKTIIDSTPGFVLQGVGFKEARAMMDRLVDAQALAEVVEHHRPIYIPAVLNGSLGIGTVVEFAGNDFYCPLTQPRVQTPAASFFEKNIRSFIQHILEHAADGKTQS